MATETATLVIRADTKGLKKATADLKQVDRQADKTSKSAKALGASLARVGKIAGLATAALGGLFARAVVRNTIAQEKAVAQLNAVLKSTGTFSEEASQGLQDYAAELQKITTFGDETIIGAQSLLKTFKQIGDETFPRATRAVLDMSVAMNQGLKESSIQLGKALNDPITGLTAMARVGITFSDSQKEAIISMQEMGDLAGAQALILEELESQFEGSAEAARNTLGGALDAVKNAFGDLLEGDSGGEGMRGATDSLNELAEILSSPEVKEGFQTLTQGALSALGALAQLPGVIGYLKDELLALFGVVEKDDFVRRMDQIAELEEDYADAVEKSTNIFGMRNTMWEAYARNLDIQITKEKELLDLDMLFYDLRKKGLTQLEELPRATKQLNEARSEEIDLIRVKAKLHEDTKALGVLEDLQFEVEMIGKSNVQREIAIALKRAETEETTLLGQAIAHNIELLDQEEVRKQEAAEAERLRQEEEKAASDALMKAEEARQRQIEDIAQGAADRFSDVVNGAKSAKEAFQDFAKAAIAELVRVLVYQAMVAAFGGAGMGGGGGGSFNIGALFGAGRAVGGSVYPGRLHPVGESRPEILHSSGKQYLIPGPQGGRVEQITNNTTNDSRNTTIINLPPTVSRETPQQVADRVALNQRWVVARNE